MMAIFGGFLLILSVYLDLCVPAPGAVLQPGEADICSTRFYVDPPPNPDHRYSGHRCADRLRFLSGPCFIMPQAALFMMLFGMPLVAFVNSYFLTSIFKRYMPKEDTRKRRECETAVRGRGRGDPGRDSEPEGRGRGKKRNENRISPAVICRRGVI